MNSDELVAWNKNCLVICDLPRMPMQSTLASKSGEPVQRY